METVITLVVAVLVFALLWWLVSLVPLPANAPPAIRAVLYILLIVVAVAFLYQKFLA